MIQLSTDLTVVIPSSCVPIHPSIAMIRNAVRSIRQVLALPASPIVVCCDGLPADQSEPHRYLEYQQRLHDFAATEGLQVVGLDTHVGLPGVLLEAFRHVRTPLALVFQHDFEVLRQVDVDGICQALLCDDLAVNHVCGLSQNFCR